MNNARALLAAATAVAVLMAIAAAMLTQQAPADASTLSRGSRGWLIARRYLEEKGSRVTLLDAEPEAAGQGVLVVAFPWQHIGFDSPMIGRHLQGGGTILFAYSGQRYDGSEAVMARELDLSWEPVAEDPPLNPFRWRKYASREWSLTADDTLAAGLRSARIDALDRIPKAPDGARVLVRGPAGRALGFVFPRGRGRVVALPADALSNARIGEPGNADLLEMLRNDLGEVWSFDEFHHGLSPPPSPAERGPQRGLTLYLLQIVFVYLLVVFAVARRFGPTWREPAVASGSAATFLLGLGALHHQLGHHREAARLLVSRAREFDPRLTLADPPETAEHDLLELARRVAEAQSGKVKNA